MTILNNGILNGIRRIGLQIRDLTIDGGLPGTPLGYRLRGATQSGAPQNGTWKSGDVVPDRTGILRLCTKGGNGTAAKWFGLGAQMNTSSSAPVLTPAFSNGTAAQLADTVRDYMLYLEVGVAGTAFSLAIGPTSTPANTIVTSSTPVAGGVYTIRIPAGWYVVWAGTTTTIATQTAVGC